MALDQHVANLVDMTVRAFNGDVTVVSPLDGISLIDSWTSALRSSGQSANPVVGGLSDLKAELQSGNPNGDTIQSILEDLADQVKAAADSAETDVKAKLTSLHEALQGFSQQLGGSSKRTAPNELASDATAAGLNPPGQDAPMTSTVGGESTTNGVGVSSLTDDDDDLSNRTGGVTGVTSGSTTYTSGAPADDMDDSDDYMDDTLGSDGGAQAASSMDDENDTPGSHSTKSTPDASDFGAPSTGSASVGGMGVSGGTADSDS